MEKYLQTKKQGNSHICVCPFHQDSTPSLSISESKNIFKCFACNASGDAISFVMRIDKLPYIEAIKKIGTLLQIDVSSHVTQFDPHVHLYNLNELVKETYHKSLFNRTAECQQALKYLQEDRKLTKKTITKYKIGYAPQNDVLTPVFKAHQEIKESTIRDSKLFCTSKNFVHVPFFHERIIFPIHNHMGRVAGFSGRGWSNPKYLHLPTTAIFSKNECAFNLNNLVKDNPIYLFEGFLDLIKTDQELGLTNGIASMGGSISPTIFPRLKKYSNRMILCLDNDDPGRNFTMETGKKLISEGFEVMVVDLLSCSGKDIDEIIDNDKLKTKDLVTNPIPFVEWFYKYRSPQTLESMNLLCGEVVSLVMESPKPLDHSYSIQLLEQTFSLFNRIPQCNDQDILKKIEERKNKLIHQLNQYLINPETTTRSSPKSQPKITNPFTLLAIKYQGLSDYLYGPQGKPLKDQPRNNWSLSIPEERIIDLPELKWLMAQMSEDDSGQDRPSILAENKNQSIGVKNTNDFLNNYYTFMSEYIHALMSLLSENAVTDLNTRANNLKSIRTLLDEIDDKAEKYFRSESYRSLQT